MTFMAESVAAANGLRGRKFDIGFIVSGPILTAIALGAFRLGTATTVLLMFFSSWLITKHHVGATFTKLLLDGNALRAGRSFWTLVLATLFVLLYLADRQCGWLLGTAYFFMSIFHYTRQNLGFGQLFYRGGGAGKLPLLDRGLFYLVPVAAIAYRIAHWDPARTFNRMPLLLPPVFPALAWSLMTACGLCVILWMVSQVDLMRRERWNARYAAFAFSHFALFAVCFVWQEPVEHGWFALSLSHGIQYILFVWAHNRRQAEGAGFADAPVLAVLSRRGRLLQYFAVTFAASLVLYVSLSFLGLATRDTPGVATAAVMAVNFFHYGVDAFIWRKARGKSMIVEKLVDSRPAA
jgi:hypothetical protein